MTNSNNMDDVKALVLSFYSIFLFARVIPHMLNVSVCVLETECCVCTIDSLRGDDVEQRSPGSLEPRPSLVTSA